MPVDDLGPTRSARYPDAMNVLCENFVASGYDPKWLVRAIANTDAYQRKIQSKPATEGELPFASATPVPLRSDVVFNSLVQVFGLSEDEMGGRINRSKGKSKDMKEVTDSKEMADSKEMTETKEKKQKPALAFLQSPRFQFDTLFGIDPSVPKDDITGNIPQSLMMMNSRNFRAGLSAKGDSRLNKILAEHKDNREAVQQLFLLVLSREPSAEEVKICSDYIAEVKPRAEAYEDLMWSLLNSSEFISRR